MTFARAFGVGLLVLLGCTRASGETRRDVPVASVPTAAAATTPTLPSPPSGAWTEALRAERWADALALIDELPESERALPAVRLAGGIAAEYSGASARGFTLLRDLERELTPLAERIRAHRAAAAFAAGELREALSYYGTRTDNQSRLRAARANSMLGERALAEQAVRALLKDAPRRGSTCSWQAPAHALLAEVLPAAPETLRFEQYHWLATRAPRCDCAERADLPLQQAPAPFRLGTPERLQRAQTFAGAGELARVEAELVELGAAQPPLEPGLADALRGEALFQARNELDRATSLLTRAAAANATRRAEWLFLAARTRERAYDSPAARSLFEAVKSTGSAFVEPAEYRVAQLAYSDGRFGEAASDYDRYLTRFGKHAKFLSDARDERAVAWLATGDARRARKAFAELGSSARDDRSRVRYLELEAVALLRAGEREAARTAFREVIRLQPLSFAALCARAHLATLQESGVVPALPASAEPSPAARVLEPEFPAGARLLHQLGLDREAESALADSEREVSAQYPGRGDEALCLLYGRLASAERAFRLGQRVASEQELNHAPQASRRWLWDCVYPRPYAGLVEAAASEHAIAPELVYAVMRQESSFRPQVTSPANAVGLLQILPSTAQRLSSELGLPFAPSDLTRPATNVRLGAFYLSKLLTVFQGNLALAVASYNAGPRAVAYWLEHARGLDLELFVARIPYEETRSYVERVVGNYARYQYLQTGEELRLTLELPPPVADPSALY